MSGDREWSTEDGRWIYPDDVAHSSGAVLRAAFWEAVSRHGLDYVGTEDNGDEGYIDSVIPDALFEHMAAALAELR